MHALQQYQGTVLFVSHDRYFVSGVGRRVLALSPDGLDDFHGGYEEYLEKQGEDYLTVAGPAVTNGNGHRDGAQSALVPDERTSYAGRKDRRSNLAMLKRSVERLEREAAELETELARLEAMFADPAYYERTPRERLEEDVRRQEGVKARLAAALVEWEQSATDLEALEVEA
jgi:hypothetical protein